MTTETALLIAKARADIAAHVDEDDAYRPIATKLLDTVDALLTAVINQGVVDHSRVEVLENQVRALATAVLSITEAVSQAAPAIVTLQDEMDRRREDVRAEENAPGGTHHAHSTEMNP